MIRRLKSDSGFTLPELLIAFIVLSVVIVPLAASLLIGLATTASSAQKTSDSSDAQLFSNYFAGDVRSSDEVGVSGSSFTFSGPTYSCSAAGTPVLRLHWVDTNATGAAHDVIVQHDDIVVYAINGATVVRTRCVDGSAISSITVVRSLSGNAFTASCDGVTCTDATNKPAAVSVTVTDKGSGHAPADDPFTFTLSAQRRVTA